MKQEKSTLMILTEGAIFGTALLAGMNIVSPGYGTRFLSEIAPYAGGFCLLTGCGLLAFRLLPRREQPHKIMEQIFRRCGICVKEGDNVYYPELLEKSSHNGNWFLLYSLPYGMSGKDIEQKLDALQTAFGEVSVPTLPHSFSITLYYHK